MLVTLTPEECRAAEAALKRERVVRVWRRLKAILLLDERQHPQAVAKALGCSLASVYNWATAWHAKGVAGLAEGRHTGRRRQLDTAAEAILETLLRDDPQAHGHHATGWTVPLLRGELETAGYAVSERTIRRALQRLKWRWKRPKYVLGRPDPGYAEKRGA
jgi:transposase